MRGMRRLVALVCLLVCAAARAASTPSATATDLFEAMHAGDGARLKSIYSERAWKLLDGMGVDDQGRDLPQQLQQRMSSVQCADVMSTKETGNTAIVTVKITQIPASEDVHLF